MERIKLFLWLVANEFLSILMFSDIPDIYLYPLTALVVAKDFMNLFYIICGIVLL